jgi:hypothetical protein
MSKIVHGQLARWHGARSWAEGALARARAPQSPQGLLGIYLNDHLAGARQPARRAADTSMKLFDSQIRPGPTTVPGGASSFPAESTVSLGRGLVRTLLRPAAATRPI